MGVKLLNFPECVNCYHEDCLDCKCVETNLNGVLLHFILYYLECSIYCNK
jgi:hypothetical protein